MRMTAALRKEINKAVRENVAGPSPSAEVGIRLDRTRPGEEVTCNTLAWGDWDENPWLDFCLVKNLDVIEEIEGKPGRAALDLYVVTGHGGNRELETNVYVAIVDGHVVGATSDDFASDGIEALARGEG